MLRQFLFAATICVAIFSPAYVAAQNLKQAVLESEKSVVKIRVSGVGGESIGSGFVVDASGVLVTNVHVLAGASKAIATFEDGSSYEIKGTYYFDESRDICVAQLNGRGFTAIALLDDVPEKGETVIALGSPHGLDFSITKGIVSGVRDGATLSDEFEGDWIQVDAALSPGNSGGPLIDSRGVVVAMSTLASSGSAQNLNFGVSSIDVLDAIDAAADKDLQKLSSGLEKCEFDGVQSKPQMERCPTESRPNVRKLETGLSKTMSRDVARTTTSLGKALSSLRTNVSSISGR